MIVSITYTDGMGKEATAQFVAGKVLTLPKDADLDKPFKLSGTYKPAAAKVIASVRVRGQDQQQPNDAAGGTVKVDGKGGWTFEFNTTMNVRDLEAGVIYEVSATGGTVAINETETKVAPIKFGIENGDGVTGTPSSQAERKPTVWPKKN